jgi:hypothetical protein
MSQIGLFREISPKPLFWVFIPHLLLPSISTSVSKQHHISTLGPSSTSCALCLASLTFPVAPTTTAKYFACRSFRMRYLNWDVLLFPAGSKVPMQEFKTGCYAVQDPEFLGADPLAGTPCMPPSIECLQASLTDVTSSCNIRLRSYALSTSAYRGLLPGQSTRWEPLPSFFT